MTSDGLRRTPLTDALRTVEELAAPLEREAVIDSIGRAAAESIGADLGFVGLLDGPDKLRLTGVHGGETDALESLRVERGRGLGGKVLAEGGADFVSDYAVADSITHDYDAPIAREGLAGVLCLPLVVSDDLIGVAYVSDRVPTSYSDVQLDRVLTAVESARLALTMADRSRQLTEAAIEVERERTAKALDASVGEHLGQILEIARTIAADPTSSASLIAQASNIIETAGNASTALRGSVSGLVVPEPAAPITSLTPRELEVVQLAARGLSNPEIATELYLARGTVKAYMESVLQKLEARNRVEAVMIAARAGLLDGI